MAGREPQDSYNPLQTVAPTASVPNNYATTKADSGSFGGQVGQALSNLGEQVKQSENTAFGIHEQYQGQLNELTATNADATNAEKVGKIQSDFRSKEGMEAVAAYPDYVVAIKKANQEILDSLPNLATKRAFAVMTAKSTAYAIKDGGDYSASQFKAAQRSTNEAVIKLYTDKLGDPNIAVDNHRSYDAMQGLKSGIQDKIQLAGFWPEETTRNEKGDPTFPDTDRGRIASTIYQNQLSEAQKTATETRFKTLINDPRIGADKAWEIYQQTEKDMSPATKASVLAMIRPRVVDAQTRGIADQTAADWHQKYLGSFNNGQGNTGDFDSAWQFTLKHEGGYSAHDANGAPVNFGINQSAHPEIDVSKLTPEIAKDIAKSGYWEKIDSSLPANMKAAAFDTAYIFGPQAAKKMIDQAGGDPQKLIDIRATHMQDLINKDPQKYGKFTNAWEQRNNDLRNFSKSTGPANGPTNPNGGHMSEADYLETNWDQYIEDARTEASNRGLDAQAVDLAESRAKSRGMNMIEAQHMKDRADSDLVARAINGEFNNGVPLTHEYQLQYGPPEVRDAWLNLQTRDPLSAGAIQTRRLPGNASQANKGYGDNFYQLYQGIENGTITSSAQLMRTNSNQLSNVGLTLLQKKMQERSTPEGQAAASAESKFFQDLHNNATGASLFPGLKSADLEKNFVKQLPAVFDRINFEKANKTPPAEMFNPQSPHFVGNAFEMPDPSKVIKEGTKSALNTWSQNQTGTITTAKSNDDLLKLINDGKITRSQARAYSIKKGWSVEAPDVPLPSREQ